MKTKRRKETTIEIDERLILRRRSDASEVRYVPFAAAASCVSVDHAAPAWCEECGEEVQMVTADEAAILAGGSSRAIYQLIEARKLHFVEPPDRVVLICLNSLGNLS